MAEYRCNRCGKPLDISAPDYCRCELDPLQHAMRIFAAPEAYGPNMVQFVDAEHARWDAKDKQS